MPTVNGPDEITSLEGSDDKVFFSNNDGEITELALGASGTVLTSGGLTAAPTWEAAAAGGEVTLNVATGKSVTAGDAVVITSGGTVQPVESTVNFTKPTGYGPSDSLSGWYSTGTQIVYAEYDDMYHMFYQDSSNQLRAMPLQVTPSGTVTLAGGPTTIASNTMSVYQAALAQGSASYSTVYFLYSLTTSGYAQINGGSIAGSTYTAQFNSILYYTSFGGYPRATIESPNVGSNLSGIIAFGRYAQSYGYGGWWQGFTLNSSGGLSSTGSFYNSSPATGTYFDRLSIAFNPDMALSGYNCAAQVAYNNDTSTGIDTVAIAFGTSGGTSGTAQQINTEGQHSADNRIQRIDSTGGSRWVVGDRNGWDGTSGTSANEWARLYCFTKTSGAVSGGYSIGNNIQGLIGTQSAGTYTATVQQGPPSFAWNANANALMIAVRENATTSPAGVGQGAYLTAAEFTGNTTMSLIVGAGPAGTQLTIDTGAQQYPQNLTYGITDQLCLVQHGTGTSAGNWNISAVLFSTSSDKEDYIGIAQTTESAGNPVAVKHIGSIDETQTGLTVAGKYYVQNDGTLSTASTTVPAGNALSATKLLLRDNL